MRTAEQGLFEMRNVSNGARITAVVGAVSFMSVMSLALGGTTPAAAQDMSEKSVRTLMEYAWALTPERFTKPDGVTVEIDKKNLKSVEVPIKTAQEVIKVGRLTAHAQMCQLADEQTQNYRSLMLREQQKKLWSEQQLIYMNQLHLVTVMLLTGKLQLVEREEGKEPKVVEETVAPVKSCAPEQAAKVKEAVAAYVKTGPSLAAAPPVAVPPKGAAATPTPASAPAPQKK